MTEKKKGLGAGTLIALGLVAVLGVGLFIAAGSYISANNYGAAVEAQLKAAYSDMDNVLGQYSQKVAEVGQVPAMYRDDVKDVFKASIEGRYGPGGSKAMFQFLKEQNPAIDSGIYKQVQQVMESGRNEFQNSQTRMLDIKRGYEAQLGMFWSGIWLRIAGYPKKPLDDYKVITSEYAQQAFQTGVSKPITLR